MRTLRFIKRNEPDPVRRRLWFDLRDAGDGLTAASAAGQQPQISVNHVAFAAAGIGVLVDRANGAHYAELTQAATNIAPGSQIDSQYGSGTVAWGLGDAAVITAYDPYTDIETIRTQSLLIAATVPSVPATSGPVSDAIGAETVVYWSHLFTAPGVDITGWTFATFTVKSDPNSDEDKDALIAVRVSNPAAAASDGVKVHNGVAVALADAMRGRGIVTVESAAPDASIRVTLQPDALRLPPSPSGTPYTYEVDYWGADGHKRQLGKGGFELVRSVRRGAPAP